MFREKSVNFDQKLNFLRFFSNFPVEAEKHIFQTKYGLFLHHNSLQNSILIKLKYGLSILEILDFALLRYPKKAGSRTSARLTF